MSMFKTIADAQLQARKDKNAVKASLLTVILGEFARAETKEQPTDEVVFAVLAKMKKGIDQSIAASPSDVLATELQIVTELQKLNPNAPADEDELINLVSAYITTLESPPNQGVVMKYLKAALGDRLDGKVASGIVSKLLSR